MFSRTLFLVLMLWYKYIGATTWIGDPSRVVSAAEITTVESRHNTILNTFNGNLAVSDLIVLSEI